MTLDELIETLGAKLGNRSCVVRQVRYWDGSSADTMIVDGRVFATWEGTLVNPPVFDGKTPRGPKDYHSLKFHDEHDGNTPAHA